MSQNSSIFISNSKNHKIITKLNAYFDNCDEFIISVAFITLSGVTCILESLRQLELKGARGKILTGCYLNFTEPKALERLQKFSNIEIKVVASQNFHAKGFFFRKNKDWQIIIGSSNLTQSALTTNIEWNVSFNFTLDTQNQILDEFTKLYYDSYPLADILDSYREIYQNTPKFEPQPKIVSNIKANVMQLEALASLQALRKQGESKALIISATGTGKTFLSAFDVKSVQPRRCLFIVHRTNIAQKAKETFAKIIKDKSLGLYTGSSKDDAEYLFATIQTLTNSQTLQNFTKNEFDYIIVDEVHHAEAKSYQKVLDYFEPKFLLGMTATPERSDQGDIFKLFDNNIAYEIRLHQALEQEILCSFHYFAVEDLYIESEKQLAKSFTKLVSDERVNHILEKSEFYGHSGDTRKALMFVSNVEEAIVLSDKLTAKGVSAKALTSKTTSRDRDEAISQLEHGELEILITVDIFNEGIDIPAVNQIIMLRPTQSATVYIQQLGRGLRKFAGKEFVVILDFIANYENNFLIPVALSQDNSYDKDALKQFIVSPSDFIAGQSTITFTDVAKEIIYQNIQKTSFSQLKIIKRDFIQLHKELGRVPSLLDFHKHNFISPKVILEYKDTYFDVLKSLKVNVPEISVDEYNILKFISKEFTPAKRLYETLILENLLIENEISRSELIERVGDQITGYDTLSFENALKHLSLVIFTVNAGRDESKPLIEVQNNNIKLLQSDLFQNSLFLYQQVSDLLEYNKIYYANKYSQNRQYGLARDVKYSKKAIAHILNLDYTNGGVNLAGYRFVDDMALLFMTFDENKKFSKYDNQFLKRDVFTFYSKSNRQLNNIKYINEISLANNAFINLVFVRVNKSDDYYFLGDATCQNAENIASNINICYTFKLKNTMADKVWQYFKNIQKHKS